MAPYRILALDGGGCRAIIESTLLKRLLVNFPDLFKEVDLFTGTSAGAILALSFAAGFSNEDTSKFYENDVKEVFEKCILREFESLGSGIGAEYGNENLKKMLSKQFGDLKLRDLKRKVLVPAFQLDNSHPPPAIVPSQGFSRRWVPRFFHNLNDSPVQDESVVDVCMRTTAAPTYFPIYQGFVDGGVFANNPSLCAITAAIAAGVKLEDIVVLSLSTGKDGLYLSEATYKGGDWGLLQWAPKLTDLLLDAGIEVIDFQCAQLLGKRYHRIDPPLPKPIPLDQPKEMPMLEQLANSVDLDCTETWLKEVWQLGDSTAPPPLQNTPTTTPGVPQSKVNTAGYCAIM